MSFTCFFWYFYIKLKIELKQVLSILLLLITQSLCGQCDSLLALLMNTNEPSGIKEINQKILDQGNFVKTCYPRLFQAYQKNIDEKRLTDLMLRVVSKLTTIGENKEAINLGLLLHRNLKNETGNDTKLGNLTNQISNSYVYLNKLDSVMYYADLCERYYVKAGEVELLFRPNYNKYLMYLALKNYKKADYYLNKSYSYVKDSKNRMNKGFVLHSILVALKSRGDDKIFEQYLKEYILFKKQGKGLSDMLHLGMDDFFDDQVKGKATLERVIKILMKDSLNQNMPEGFRGAVLGGMYERDKEYEKAENLYLGLLKQNGGSFDRKTLYLNLYELYKKKGEEHKAFNVIEKYIILQDSSFQQIFDGKIADYEVKYKTHEKEKELLKKDLELSRSKNRQRSLIGLAFFLTTLGGVGYYIYRRKLKHQREMVEKDALIQKQRIADLEQKNKLLALNSMIEGQESERLRIAQDLHDGLGGLLTTVKAHFNAIEREIANIKEMNIYAKTNQLIDEACVEVRRIAHDMVPYSLKMNGLEGVLSDIRQTVLGKGIQCDVDIHNVKEEVLGEQKVVMIYRIIQEVVTNALKHSGASHILIQLVGHENGLNVMIEDNGKGFDVNQLLQGKGLGLKSIESRVKYLEGTMNIDSTPNQGTTINIEIPLYQINTN